MLFLCFFIIAVESERYVKGETSIERRCFICSITPNATKFSQAVRQHWSIENNLHWQLDVTFDEDKLKMRINNAAQNLSILRRMVLNVLKQEASKGSLKGKRKKAGWSEEYLYPLQIPWHKAAPIKYLVNKC